VRAVSGDKTAFAYSDVIGADALMNAARATRTIAARGAGRVKVSGALVPGHGHALYGLDDPIPRMDATQKVALLERVERMARAKDPRVRQVMAGLAAEYDVVLVARSDGHVAADVRPLVRLSLSVIAEQGGRREQGHSGGGGRVDFAHFDDERIERYVDEAVHAALTNLDARPAPAGTMTVVLGPGWPGVLLHEAVGHGLEGDFNRKGSSVFAGRVGERVASAASPSSTTARCRSARFAERRRRGQPDAAQRADRGRHPARIPARFAQRAPDEERRYRQRPARVFRASAHAAHDEHLHARRRARSGRDPRIGGPRAVCSELRRRTGRHHERQVRVLGFGGLVDRERPPAVPGEGRDDRRQRPTRQRVTMIGNDMRLDPGIGVCGKDGQSVPVGVGQPTLRIEQMTVGGTA